MWIRALMGPPRGYRELVVRPRPVASFPRIFAVGSLATATVLSATLVGTFQLGTVAGLSGYDGGRIMGMPLTPGSTFPFFAFGRARPADTTSTARHGRDVTEASSRGASVAAPALHATSVADVPRQRVTMVSAILRTPLTEGGTTRVVSVFSTYAAATVATAPKPSHLLEVLAQPKPRRAIDASEHATKGGHTAKAHRAHKAHRHARAPRDTKVDKVTRSA